MDPFAPYGRTTRFPWSSDDEVGVRSQYPRVVKPKINLEQVRKVLVAERSQLLDKLAELGLSSDGGPSSSVVLDSGQVRTWRGERRSTDEELRAGIQQVDHALMSLDSGKYGICEMCGDEIAPDRLEARPASPLCIDCARKSGR